MKNTQLLLAQFPEKFAGIECKHARIYVGINENGASGRYQIGWAMYLYDNPEHSQPDEQEPLVEVHDLALSPDELNAILDAFQELPSIYGDDDFSCDYKLILSH